MKKTIIIIVAVAILGGLFVIGHGRGTPSKLVPASSTGAASNNSGSSSSSSTAPATAASYKDGTYTGNTENSPYGTVQIAVVISGGKITNVNFLQMPYAHAYSQTVTTASEPLLKHTTIQAQSSNIEFVSGATFTSQSYEMSLQSALDQAKV